MENKYYEHKETGKRSVAYSKISNGYILTLFEPKTGTPYGNLEYRFFVTPEELKELYTEFPFKIETSENINRIVAKALSEIVYQLQNYGIAEDQARCFKEFEGSSPIACGVFRDMVRDDKAEFKDFLSNEDDEWDFASAEDLFEFLHTGVTPILKKMLLEIESTQ